MTIVLATASEAALPSLLLSAVGGQAADARPKDRFSNAFLDVMRQLRQTLGPPRDL
jgi:hypothetical protein